MTIPQPPLPSAPGAPPHGVSKDADYLLAARTQSGKRVVRRVTARTADEAIARLGAEGFREVALVTDDFGGNMPLVSDQARRNTRKNFTPAQQSRINNLPLRTLMLWMVARCFVTLSLPIAVVLVFFIWRRWAAAPWGFADAMTGTVLLLPFGLAWRVSRGSRLFHRVQREGLRNRYDRVLRLLPALQKSMQPLGESAAALCIAEWRGRALARLGRHEEALAAVEAIRALPGVSAHQYHFSRAQVIMSIRDYPAALAEYERAIDADPNKPMTWLGAAELLAVYLDRPAEARVYLQAARQFPASEESERLLRWLEAAIDLGEGRAARAVATFGELLPHFEHRARCMPMGRGFLMVTRSLMCRACAASGDHLAARRHYDAVRGFLELHKLSVFLEPCRRAIG